MRSGRKYGNNWGCCLLTYLLTPWCRVLLEKLTGLQLAKKLPAFHGTRRFITVLTSVRHLSVSCYYLLFENKTIKRSAQCHVFPSHRQAGAPTINIQSTFRTTPDLWKNVSL